MIMVICHTQERNEYDHNGRLMTEKGTVWVSHGVNVETGRNIILPEEEWRHFKNQCTFIDGEWYIK
jgi:hypothetical protein